MDEPSRVYALGDGCSDCRRRGRACLVRGDRTKCASCTAQGIGFCVVGDGVNDEWEGRCLLWERGMNMCFWFGLVRFRIPNVRTVESLYVCSLMGS